MEKKIAVVQAFLHSDILVPGFIMTEKHLSAAKIKGLKMWLTPMGLLLEGGKHDCLVPLANIKNMLLEGGEEKKEEKKLGKAA